MAKELEKKADMGTADSINERLPGKISLPWAIFLILLPVVCGLGALCAGRMSIPVSDVIAYFTGGQVEDQVTTVISTMRLPRVLLAVLVGSGLSVAGCVYQSLFANPLATPDTLGVASGASFGAALSILIGFQMLGAQVFSFIMGIIAVLLTVITGYRRDGSRVTIILAGIMISSLFSALVSLVKYVADTESQLPAITYWLMGSLNITGYQKLIYGAPVIIIGIFVLLLLRWRLNLLPLSDDEAETMGVNVRLLRGTSILCATAITASCVAMCGQVGWVGLIVPHICRMIFGSNHLSLIPACIGIGSAFMIIVDTAARSLTPAEIPVSILTAIIGAPFFIILMRKSGGWNL